MHALGFSDGAVNERQAALRCLDGLLRAEAPLPGVPHRSALTSAMRRLEGSDLRSPAVRCQGHGITITHMFGLSSGSRPDQILGLLVYAAVTVAIPQNPPVRPSSNISDGPITDR